MTSYQKQKKLIEALHQQNEQLKSDIFKILDKKDSETIMKYQLMIDIEKQLWFGNLLKTNSHG